LEPICGNVLEVPCDYRAHDSALRVRICPVCSDDVSSVLRQHRILRKGDIIPPFNPAPKIKVYATCTVNRRHTQTLRLNSFVSQLILNCPICFKDPGEKCLFELTRAVGSN
jgi:hypothetical protein